MDYLSLKNEIVSDPLARGYSAMTDLQVAADMNSKYREQQFAYVDSVRQYLIKQVDGTGVNKRSSIDMIKEYAESGTVRGASAGENAPAARQSAARMIWYMLQREDSAAGFPINDPNVADNFIAIGPDGGNGPSVLSGAQLVAIADLGKDVISRGEELGLGDVRESDVFKARAL